MHLSSSLPHSRRLWATLCFCNSGFSVVFGKTVLISIAGMIPIIKFHSWYTFIMGWNRQPRVLNQNSDSWKTGTVKPRKKKSIKKKHFFELICGTPYHNIPLTVRTNYKSVDGWKLRLITSATRFNNRIFWKRNQIQSCSSSSDYELPSKALLFWKD